MMVSWRFSDEILAVFCESTAVALRFPACPTKNLKCQETTVNLRKFDSFGQFSGTLVAVSVVHALTDIREAATPLKLNEGNPFSAMKGLIRNFSSHKSLIRRSP